MNTRSTRISCPARSIGPRRRLVFSLAAGVPVIAGCQTYEPKPLDLHESTRAFLARTADSSADVASSHHRLSDGRPSAQPFSIIDGIDQFEAEAIGLVYNADLRIARARAGVAQAGAANAGLWEDPVIGVDLTRIIESVENPWKLAATIGITIPLSGRLDVEIKQAGAEHAASLTRVAQQEWSTRMNIRRAWVQWSALVQEQASARRLLESFDSIFSAVDRMEQAGELPRVETRLLGIDRATRRTELAALDARVSEAELDIKRLMGLAPTAPIQLASGATIESPWAAQAGITTQPETLARTSPALATAHAEYTVAEHALELEIRKQYPDLHLGPGYGREDGNNEVLLGLSAPLPIFNANRRAIAEAAALRDVARVSYEAELEHFINALAQALVRWNAAREQLRAFNETILPMAEAQHADTRKLVELGEVNTLILLESLSRRQDVTLKALYARRDEQLASIAIDELSGPPALPGAESPPRSSSPSGSTP